MGLTSAQYIETPVRPSKQSDLKVISEMRSTKIVWFLAHRHRVGLLAFSNIALIGYVAWDKAVRWFI